MSTKKKESGNHILFQKKVYYKNLKNAICFAILLMDELIYDGKPAKSI